MRSISFRSDFLRHQQRHLRITIQIIYLLSLANCVRNLCMCEFVCFQNNITLTSDENLEKFLYYNIFYVRKNNSYHYIL